MLLWVRNIYGEKLVLGKRKRSTVVYYRGGRKGLR